MVQRFRFRSGQSLAEVLIGVAVGALFVMGVAVIIAPSLKSNTQTAQIQTKGALTKELSDNVRAWAAGNWNTVASLATSSANTYYLTTSASPFTSVSGSETVTISGTGYTRYFYVDDVYRDPGGNVTTTASGNSYDPSTKQATIVVTAPSPSSPVTYNMYLTRNANNVFSQTSWSGGSGQNNAVTFVGSQYASATGTTINAQGQIQLTTKGGSCTL